ncbi:NAD(P)/FAD-dependent oxidoreductase [Marinitoga arctica]
MKYDVIIIGAGAAGLFCASKIKNKKVLILEKNISPGKKLLISGGGKCNFTNNDDIEDLITHYNKRNFVKKALFNYSNKDLLKDIDFKYTITEEGKIFPKTMNSKTVLKWLLNNINKNTSIKFNTKISNIEKKDIFKIKTNHGEFKSDILIVATGGKSYPILGTNGDGYNIAKKFGHNIINPKPALSPIIIKNYPFKDLSGSTINVIIKKGKSKYYGRLLFTHKGFSGPVVLNNSRYFENGDKLSISFVNFNNEELFRNDLQKKMNKNILLFDVLKKYNLSKRFIAIMFKKINLDKRIKCNVLSKKNRNLVINYLYNQKFVIDKVGDFNIAMVTSGGIDTKEIDSKTMESKIVKNLYFIGEVIDIDGDTGGYNIQWAFSSAKSAADFINKNF